MKNCIVAQSGGPTAVINASLCGVATRALKSEYIDKVYGAINGIQGVINEKFTNLDDILTSSRQEHLLSTTPASFLGSCRYKMPHFDKDLSIYKTIFDIFTKHNIGYFFYIGGNDSMDTVDKLSAYAKKIDYPINIIGVPKTVDNDLMATDHTPGFGSAAKYIATTVREIGLDSDVYDLNSVTIVEIMGGNTGWLTAASVMARMGENTAPHLIYLPELAFSREEFLQDIKALNAKGIKNVIIAISEGAKFADGTYVCESSSSGLTDTFGHKCLSGTAKVIESIVRDDLGYKSRGVEINVSQRCAAHLSSQTDVEEAILVGESAVVEAEKGGTGKMMTFIRKSNNPYMVEIGSVDISKIANGEKTIPREWINERGNDVTKEMVDYVAPLIIGETKVVYKDGVPVYLNLKKY